MATHKTPCLEVQAKDEGRVGQGRRSGDPSSFYPLGRSPWFEGVTLTYNTVLSKGYKRCLANA